MANAHFPKQLLLLQRTGKGTLALKERIPPTFHMDIHLLQLKCEQSSGVGMATASNQCMSHMTTRLQSAMFQANMNVGNKIPIQIFDLAHDQWDASSCTLDTHCEVAALLVLHSRGHQDVQHEDSEHWLVARSKNSYLEIVIGSFQQWEHWLSYVLKVAQM